jgi:hypothetical protein
MGLPDTVASNEKTLGPDDAPDDAEKGIFRPVGGGAIDKD